MVLSTESADTSGKCVGAVLMIEGSDRRHGVTEWAPQPRRVPSGRDGHHEKENRYPIHQDYHSPEAAYFQPNCTQYIRKIQYRAIQPVHVHAGM
jgi:hypothetical protein